MRSPSKNMASFPNRHGEQLSARVADTIHPDDHVVEPLDPMLAGLSLPHRDPSAQPMIQGWCNPDYSTPNAPNGSLLNKGMPFFSALPSSSEEYIDSEAAAAPYIPRYHSPSCSDRVSTHSVYSEYSDSEPSTWPSPDPGHSTAYMTGAPFGNIDSFVVDEPCLNIFGDHSLAVNGPYAPLDFDLHEVQEQQQGNPHLSGLKVDASDLDVTFQWCLQEPYSAEPIPLHSAFNEGHLMPPVKSQQTRQPTDIPGTTSSFKTGGRVRKTSNASTRSGRKHTGHRPDRDTSPSAARRTFICPLAPYGCLSAFASKNEWKRHTRTQHMRMGFWRCDQCPRAARQPNDFNRKDLFVQHVRRMHALQLPTDDSDIERRSTSHGSSNDMEDQILGAIAERCYLQLRAPPTQCCCVFCDETFDGPNAWDERVEHIGKHFEMFKKHKQCPPDVTEWAADTELERWLASERIIARQADEWSYWIVHQ